MTLDLAKSPVLIRKDLQEALNTAWLRLGVPQWRLKNWSFQNKRAG